MPYPANKKLPAFCRLLIALPGFNPAVAFRRGFALPERCAGFEIIHNKLPGFKRTAAMRTGDTEFIPTRIAILTVSNRRGEEDDTSGHYLRDSAQEAGHHVVDKAIVKENRYAIRAQVSAWIASDDVQVVLITGGTGLTEGDQAPEALLPLFDREVEGFGEVFRMLSFEEIGTSTLQSRAVAGVANKTLIFAMPGSTKACRTAWENIIAPQLDARTRPCNFHPHLKK